MQIILRAMKKYGLILADNGSDWFINGTTDDCWGNDPLVSEFKQLKGNHFEAVDVSSLILNPDSGKARSRATPVKSLTWLKLLVDEKP